jgi:hypothetical protein
MSLFYSHESLTNLFSKEPNVHGSVYKCTTLNCRHTVTYFIINTGLGYFYCKGCAGNHTESSELFAVLYGSENYKEKDEKENTEVDKNKFYIMGIYDEMVGSLADEANDMGCIDEDGGTFVDNNYFMLYDDFEFL